MNQKLLVFHQLQIAHSALFRAADHRCRSEIGLTTAQLAVLFVLTRTDGQPISVIAQKLAMGKSSLTGLIDRLCDKNFVRREVSPIDGRVSNIFLEPIGREVTARGLIQTEQYNKALLAPFSEIEQRSIQRFLQHLTDNAGDIINP